MMWAMALDDGRMSLYEDITFKLPIILVLCFTAFNLALKNSIEQAVLYLTARQALGEITTEETGLQLRQGVEARPNRSWLFFKTYAPACALLLLTGALQFQKFPVMTAAIYHGRIHTVKALQATGVPLPLWALEGAAPPSFRRWIRRVLFFPRGYNYRQPYLNFVLQSHAMTEFLIEKGFDISTTWLTYDRDLTPPGIGGVIMTPLHVALADRRIEIARLLIAHGADVHARDSIGRTPLIVAITNCPQAIELLLTSGADINEETRFGPTLLAAARYQWIYDRKRRGRENANAVKILLEKGADPNTRDSAGRNALMVMSMENRPSDIRMGLRKGPHDKGAIFSDDGDLTQSIGEALLQAGCDVNAADKDGRTPLMYAALYHRYPAVHQLLISGANIRAKDKDGKTALEFAKQSGNKEIIRLLESPHVQPGNTK
jgi:ankyrin repeat protein